MKPVHYLLFALILLCLFLVALKKEEMDFDFEFDWASEMATNEDLNKLTAQGEIIALHCSNKGEKESIIILDGNRSFSLADKLCYRLKEGAKVDITYDSRLKALKIVYQNI